MTRRLIAPAAGAFAAALLLTLPAAPRRVLGQTIPLRPTPTLQGGSVSVLPQPTPPSAPTVVRSTQAPAPRPAASAPPTLALPVPAPSRTPSPVPVFPPQAVAPEPFRVEHTTLTATTAGVPSAPVGWNVAESAFRVTGAAPGGDAGLITITFSARDLAAAGGSPANLALFALDSNGVWTRVAVQSLDVTTGRVTFRPTGPGTFAVLARSALPDGDYAVAGGRFFRADGPATQGGFTVLDGAGGARSAFWSVYAAAGGEASLGRPISRRFMSGEQLVQHFERGIVFSDPRTNATARPGAPKSTAPAAAREPEPPPLPAS